MHTPYSIEKDWAPALEPCPGLPQPRGDMSYRNLRQTENGEVLFESACAYAQHLWLRNHPARAILALCRAVYIDPKELSPGHIQPYGAYVWFLQNHTGTGFMGNVRTSFHHQATRISADQILKRNRAWAMWHLSVAARPDLPEDPKNRELPPEEAELSETLNRLGLPGEGTTFKEAIALALENRS